MKLLIALVALVQLAGADDNYKTMKTSCIQQSNYTGKTLAELKKILLDQARREAVGELYGQMIYSKTEVKDGRLISDEIKQKAIGSVRVEGNPEFYNGKNFGEICADVRTYITKKDLEKFSPKQIELKQFCFNDPTVAMNQVKQQARYASYQEIISRVKPALKLSGEQAEEFIHGYKIENDKFDFNTASYCFDAIATILPYELELGDAVSASSGAAVKQAPAADTSAMNPLVEKLPESSFTASTYHKNDAGYAPSNAKFGATKSYSNWSAAINDKEQWLQVDLGSVSQINAVGTMGRHNKYDQYVKSYYITYSNDGIEWNYYKENKRVKHFEGNIDAHTPVKHKLAEPFQARYVRFYPLGWHEHITMRVELYGAYGDLENESNSASRPLVQTLPDERFSASTFYKNNKSYAPYLARMNEKSAFSNWTAASNDLHQWLQVDLGDTFTINAVGTAGRANKYDQYVKSYYITYSLDAFEWKTYEEDGKTKIFDGNTNFHTEVVHKLKTPFQARYVRVHPQSWYKHITMRFELYGK